jgi:hypothetical protein
MLSFGRVQGLMEFPDESRGGEIGGEGRKPGPDHPHVLQDASDFQRVPRRRLKARARAGRKEQAVAARVVNSQLRDEKVAVLTARRYLRVGALTMAWRTVKVLKSRANHRTRAD